tara:strand:+ start:140 stop:829 length:690 start_codon:yes stop_codon:yes gene_type:complete
MQPKILNLFPLTIYQSKINISDSDKNEMINEILEMKKKTNKKKDNDSWTGDTQGYENLFSNKKFDVFFLEVSKHLRKYLEYFDIDNEKIDLYYQRAWATVSDSKENIKVHTHLQSHISFAYYLKKTNTDSQIIFVDKKKHNEFLPGLFDSPSVHASNIFKKRNFKNVTGLDLAIEENDIIIFPSKTSHGTKGNVINDNRISISADIMCISKNSANLEHLVPPINQWKKV